MQSRPAAPITIVVIGIAVACALMGLCVLQLFQSRTDALERASETSRNLGLIVERDIQRNFELYDLSLQAVIDGLKRPDVMNAPPSVRRAVLFDNAMTARFLGSMLVLDADGNIVLDSATDVPRRGNFADRKYFTVHRDHPDVGLYVSDPFASRLRGGALSIGLTRRISNPDGSFAGVVLIALNLEYFHQLFAGLSLGQHGSMSLIRDDGVMVMRQPYDAQTIGRDVSRGATFGRFQAARDGVFSEKSSLDGVRRLYYFRHLPKLPLIVMVAEAEQGHLRGVAAPRRDDRRAGRNVRCGVHRGVGDARRAAAASDARGIGTRAARAHRRSHRPRQSPQLRGSPGARMASRTARALGVLAVVRRRRPFQGL